METSVISTESISTSSRELWCDVVCHKLLEGDCLLAPDRVFHGQISVMCPLDVSFSRVSSIAGEFVRTPQHVRRDPRDFFVVMVQLVGRTQLSQDGREIVIGPGAFACADGTRPLRLKFPDSFDQLAIYLPRHLVTNAFGPTDRLTTQLCKADSPLGSVVSPFLRQSTSVLNQVEASAARRLSDIGLSLIMTTLGELSARPPDHPSWARTSLLYRAEVFIEANAHDHTLNPGTVACALRISTRYLQELFRDKGTTPSEYIWRCRLKKCERDLSDPTFAAMNISDIALRGGFQDFAHFSHRFKAASGMSAREFRHQHQTKAGISRKDSAS